MSHHHYRVWIGVIDRDRRIKRIAQTTIPHARDGAVSWLRCAIGSGIGVGGDRAKRTTVEDWSQRIRLTNRPYVPKLSRDLVEKYEMQLSRSVKHPVREGVPRRPGVSTIDAAVVDAETVQNAGEYSYVAARHIF